MAKAKTTATKSSSTKPSKNKAAKPAKPRATPAKAGKAKAVKAAPAPAEKAKKLSALDAAHQVLVKAAAPMTAGELITAMAEQGLWTSPAGKTPQNTLYAALLREITTKGAEARFRRPEPGKFAARS
jgi:hypothetical protein